MIKIAIIQFPGSNCERETKMAVTRAGMQAVDFLWNEPSDKLAEFSGYIIVGGFSYEDRSRAGIIAALDPLMKVLIQQSELGKPILGICNGAQILVESGLVPGLAQYPVAMALTDNIKRGFYNAWVNICLSKNYQLNAFTNQLNENMILRIPVAHAQGRFVIPPALFAEMQANGMMVFQYCTEKGEIDSNFPINPNGSIHNTAAVSNRMGNVMAIMPHPERTPLGDPIFFSMRHYIEMQYVENVRPLFYQPRYDIIKKYCLAKGNHEIRVGLLLVDNHALSVQNALHKKNIPVTIKRYIHWEIESNASDFKKIIQTDILFNPRKEYLHIFSNQKEDESYFLVKTKEAICMSDKIFSLKNQINLISLNTIQSGIIWCVVGPKQYREAILNSHLLFNPIAQDCYEYPIT